MILGNHYQIPFESRPVQLRRHRRSFQSSLELRELFASVNLGDVGQEVEDTSAVTPLVVIPADKLDEVLVEGDTGLGIEDGGVSVAVQVSGDDIVLGVSEDAYRNELVSNSSLLSLVGSKTYP